MILRRPDSNGACYHAVHKAALLALILLAGQASGFADQGYVVLQPTVGGLSATPDITSMTISNGDLILNWNGFAGPYQVETRSDLSSPGWQPLGPSTNAHGITLPAAGGIGFLRVKGGLPGFAGADTCAFCHAEKHTNWSQTIHAGALATLSAIHQDKNASCLGCHTVGFGLPSGYTDTNNTPFFANVQCENCHGPAGGHATRPNDLSVRPVRTLSAKLCGGCHNGPHHPTYEEWSVSPHSEVVPDVASGFLSSNTNTVVSRMMSCGACHSGATRLALMDWGETGTLTLPSGQEAADTAQTCVVCHDPHKPNLDGTHSLRNPRYSTNFFSYNTSTSTTFTNQYNENIQVCAQCHNERGASVNDTSRPPHHSPQYNILIGDVGVAIGNVPAGPANVPATHGMIQNQCAGCHTHSHDATDPVTGQAVTFTGHDFKPHFEACVNCHGDTEIAETLADGTQTLTKQRIAELKGLLDSWATNKAPSTLSSKYGALAWEYNVPGELSNPTGDANLRGPTTAEQAAVPPEIKSARTYLYLVENDGSYGVHNGRYTRYLLGLAKTNVVNLLNSP